MSPSSQVIVLTQSGLTHELNTQNVHPDFLTRCPFCGQTTFACCMCGQRLHVGEKVVSHRAASGRRKYYCLSCFESLRV